MKLAPIVLFVYNRPWHTQKTVEALQENALASESELFVYSDAPKHSGAQENVDQVREYIKQINGFKKVTIIERDHNWGLANSIINGVTDIINKYEKIIVLEDDLVTSPYFLKFMNEALTFYKENKNVLSVTGFSFSSKFMQFSNDFAEDIYVHIRPMSWGWGTWKDEWKDIDWEIKDFQSFISSATKIKAFNRGGTDLSVMLEDQMKGKLDSWYIRWCYHAYKTSKYTIYPKISFVNNIGHDSSGIHCIEESDPIYSHTELSDNSCIRYNTNIKLDENIIRRFNKAFDTPLKNKLKKYLKKILLMEK
ncbi:hypothetical protein [Sulfurovum sp.]|uniref:hypothetical protein n=1 Tax=Sulfurovum sp. TaxID=1969726 RepID=UPI0035692B09